MNNYNLALFALFAQSSCGCSPCGGGAFPFLYLALARPFGGYGSYGGCGYGGYGQGYFPGLPGYGRRF